MAQLSKGGLVRGHDKPIIHGSCAIYFPGGIIVWASIPTVSTQVLPLHLTPWHWPCIQLQTEWKQFKIRRIMTRWNIVVYKSIFKNIEYILPGCFLQRKEVSLVQIPSRLRLLYLSRSWRTGTLLWLRNILFLQRELMSMNEIGKLLDLR